MYTNRTLSLKVFLEKSSKSFVVLTIYATLVVVAYEYLDIKWMKLPWTVLTVVGTAVAFYVGFKNNSAYERTWEARKIWEGIVSNSRTWGLISRDYITNLFVLDEQDEITQQEIDTIVKRLIFRQIAWAYRLRRQLWKAKTWEHSQKMTISLRKHLGDAFASLSEEEELNKFIDTGEVEELITKENICTELISNQSKEILNLRRLNLIDDFRHVEFQHLLQDFYNFQSKCERIKDFPLPRQYANTSSLLTYIMVLLLPYGMVAQFSLLGEGMVWLTIPFTGLIGGIYLLMEIVGDYAENPFEGLSFDTPMTSLCNKIDRELKQMIGEKDLPDVVQPHHHILL
ncbi:bestrophin family protein [Flammeovirga kamogawensis]|uniref:Bestrophin n=1 Tax=Flammeovirga kamogawensis TaxID=373891 RepID=A0ABX8GW97_9BACT|nr:bestrophin family ion channel [Flammeovirga kamogawensis]MBB6459721.1 putative membrane protein [Flammeovirga kamogawensis]QWG07220.1 hypothetical protein KM029_18240 [Flammeovirga kamogawensis]TRX69040.1 hypothetical protein EO216_13230 [Flammeovirga kamogawensis]